MRPALPLVLFLLLAPAAHAAPALRGTLPDGRRSSVVSLRAPDGSWQRFRVHRQAVMAPGRARRRSRFRGYAGRGVDDPRATVRVDTSVLGLHASVRGTDGTWFVGGPVGAPEVLAEGRVHRIQGAHRRSQARRAPGDLVVHRTYRLALVTDPSYAETVSPSLDNAEVTAAKQTLVARISQVYEDELGITLELIANPLNFNTHSTFDARYSATSCTSGALSQNQSAVDAVVGNAGYDVGHLAFGPDGDGGGVASLGVAGRTGVKARGCTGLASPVGDAFAIDYVAHELGHQFNGEHTFNAATNGSCAGNREPGSAVEPGSGSSIMAYAGICGPDDLQDHSDPYFSQRSIEEIQAYVNGGGGQGGTAVTTANHSPEVAVPAPATVPVRTPFTLVGGGSDADADPVVYTWEQNDTGAASLLADDNRTSGPLFRQFSFASTAGDTGTSPEPGENTAGPGDARRTFPDPAQIVAGGTNILGNCGSLLRDCYSEMLPTSARTLNFRLTARDLEGGVSSADTVVTVAGSTPFQVTSQSAPTSLTAEQPLEVTWDTAGTAAGPFDVANVRIAFSTDNGLSFPYTAAMSTPNDGSETITVPNLGTTGGRLRVSALGQPFFSINRGALTIAAGPGPSPSPDPDEPSPTPTAQPSPSPSPSPSASPAPGQPSPTPVPAAPSPSPAATASVSPAPAPTAIGTAVLRPVLRSTKRRLRVPRSRRFSVVLRCATVDRGVAPATCDGALRLSAKLGGRTRTIARGAFSTALARTATSRLRLTRAAYRALRRGALRATLAATVGQETASKRVVLRRRAA